MENNESNPIHMATDTMTSAVFIAKPIQPANVVFAIGDNKMEFNERGFEFKGVLIEDAGRAYRTMMAVLHGKTPDPADAVPTAGVELSVETAATQILALEPGYLPGGYAAHKAKILQIVHDIFTPEFNTLNQEVAKLRTALAAAEQLLAGRDKQLADSKQKLAAIEAYSAAQAFGEIQQQVVKDAATQGTGMLVIGIGATGQLEAERIAPETIYLGPEERAAAQSGMNERGTAMLESLTADTAAVKEFGASMLATYRGPERRAAPTIDPAAGDPQPEHKPVHIPGAVWPTPGQMHVKIDRRDPFKRGERDAPLNRTKPDSDE